MCGTHLQMRIEYTGQIFSCFTSTSSSATFVKILHVTTQIFIHLHHSLKYQELHERKFVYNKFDMVKFSLSYTYLSLSPLFMWFDYMMPLVSTLTTLHTHKLLILTA